MKRAKLLIPVTSACEADALQVGGRLDEMEREG